MRKNYKMMILEDETKVDFLTKIAANYGLNCLYKIGVYGKERQHELYIVGNSRAYKKFQKEINSIEQK